MLVLSQLLKLVHGINSSIRFLRLSALDPSIDAGPKLLKFLAVKMGRSVILNSGETSQSVRISSMYETNSASAMPWISLSVSISSDGLASRVLLTRDIKHSVGYLAS